MPYQKTGETEEDKSSTGMQNRLEGRESVRKARKSDSYAGGRHLSGGRDKARILWVLISTQGQLSLSQVPGSVHDEECCHTYIHFL